MGKAHALATNSYQPSARLQSSKGAFDMPCPICRAVANNPASGGAKRWIHQDSGRLDFIGQNVVKDFGVNVVCLKS